MSTLYEAPADDDRGHGDRLRKAAELTAADVSLLGDDITDLANLVRAGLRADVDRGAGAIFAYRDGLDVLRGRLAACRSVSGAPPAVHVTVPSMGDVLVILGREDDPSGHRATTAWLEEVRADFGHAEDEGVR